MDGEVIEIKISKNCIRGDLIICAEQLYLEAEANKSICFRDANRYYIRPAKCIIMQQFNQVMKLIAKGHYFKVINKKPRKPIKGKENEDRRSKKPRNSRNWGGGFYSGINIPGFDAVPIPNDVEILVF